MTIVAEAEINIITMIQGFIEDSSTLLDLLKYMRGRCCVPEEHANRLEQVVDHHVECIVKAKIPIEHVFRGFTNVCECGIVKWLLCYY
jgi:hypothetical protein